MNPARMPHPLPALAPSTAPSPATGVVRHSAEGGLPATMKRYALAWLPAPTQALYPAGLSWLQGLPAAPAEAAAAAPWRRQFHAVLRGAMRLKSDRSEAELLAVAGRLAAQTRAFELPPLVLDMQAERVVLRPQTPLPASHPLRELCDRCVRELDPLRAPPTLMERALRLSPSHRRQWDKEQRLLAERWGSGEVFHRWRFYVRLSERLPLKARLAAYKTALSQFGLQPWQGLQAQALAVLQQSAAHMPWSVVAQLKLRTPA
jgi:hypothetical protein